MLHSEASLDAVHPIAWCFSTVMDRDIDGSWGSVASSSFAGLVGFFTISGDTSRIFEICNGSLCEAGIEFASRGLCSGQPLFVRPRLRTTHPLSNLQSV